MIRAVVFDFGGVIAEEGFREGLKAIAAGKGLDPEGFFRTAEELIYTTGYLVGKGGEAGFWDAVRDRTGLAGSDAELRKEILVRFVLRPGMLEYAAKARSKGLTVAMLSDQTNWLDEIDRAHPFYQYFDFVFNSYKIGRSKKEPSTFVFLCSSLGTEPGETLFIDDNAGHIKRAAEQGLRVIHFTDMESFEREFAAKCIWPNTFTGEYP